MSIHIREMDITDYERVYAMWQACEGIGLSDADSKEGISRFLERNPGLSFVALEGDKIAGAALCGHDGRRGHRVKSHSMHDPETLGIASRLASRLEQAGLALTVVDPRTLAPPLASALEAAWDDDRETLQRLLVVVNRGECHGLTAV